MHPYRYGWLPLALVLPLAPTWSQAQMDWWHPLPGTRWHIQYTGTLNTSLDVDAYNIDLFDTPASVIQSLRSRGVRVICYFSAGSYEEWRPDATKFPVSVRGRPLSGWPGEAWLDIRRLAILLPIMEARIQLAVKKGCDAVDPDNVDGYTNRTGFPLSYDDQIRYNTAIANLAHKWGLAVGLKNDIEQVDDLVGSFDFTVNEQCFEYRECAPLSAFINAGKPVFNIEYNLGVAWFCPRAAARHFDSVKKRLSLGAWARNCWDL